MDLLTKLLESDQITYAALFVALLIYVVKSNADREKEFRSFMREMIPILKGLGDAIESRASDIIARFESHEREVAEIKQKVDRCPDRLMKERQV